MVDEAKWNEAFQAIGKVVSVYQDMEVKLVVLHAALAKCGVTQSFISFYDLSSKSKREIITSHTLSYIGGLEDQGKQQQADGHRPILGFMKRHKTLTTQRNYIVHGQWTADAEPGELTRMYISGNSEKLDLILQDPQSSPAAQSWQDRTFFTVAQIYDVANAIITLNKELHAFLQAKAPDKLTDKPPAPPVQQP